MGSPQWGQNDAVTSSWSSGATSSSLILSLFMAALSSFSVISEAGFPVSCSTRAASFRLSLYTLLAPPATRKKMAVRRISLRKNQPLRGIRRLRCHLLHRGPRNLLMVIDFLEFLSVPNLVNTVLFFSILSCSLCH